MGAVSRTAAERAAQAERLRARPARGRILAAASQLAESKGYEELTVGELAKAAGVSRETFYTHFADKRACLAEATAPELGQIDALLRVAGERGGRWADPLAESLEHALGDCFNSAQTPRGRILAAIVEVAAERGFAGVRISDVIRAAHVSHPVFYRHFESREQCFALACESLVERLGRRIEVRVADDRGADAGEVSAGVTIAQARLVALAELLAAEPETARVLLFEAPGLRPWTEGRAATDAESAAGLQAGQVGGPACTPLAELIGRLLSSSFGAVAGEHRVAGPALRVGDLQLQAGAVLEAFRSALHEDALAELPGRVGMLAPLLGRPASAFAGEPAGRKARGRASRRREPAPRRTAVKRLAAARG